MKLPKFDKLARQLLIGMHTVILYNKYYANASNTYSDAIGLLGQRRKCAI
jgi:hypothetical protein